VTKAFFWTAHSQMFNLLAPVMMVAVGYHIATTPRLPIWKFLATAFGAGMFLLVYGTFLILLPTMVSAFWFSRRRERLDWRRAVVVPAGAAALFALPTLVWVAITIRYAGGYFNQEMNTWREVVWIGDTLSVGLGTFLATWWKFSIRFAHTLQQPDVVPVLVIALVVYLVPRIRQGSGSQTAWSVADDSNLDALEFVCLATFSSVFVFFWMLGLYERRLTFTVAPPLLCYIGVRLGRVSLPSSWARTGRVVAPVAAVLWVVYHVAKYGPFS
jgi:hypothetical protein